MDRHTQAISTTITDNYRSKEESCEVSACNNKVEKPSEGRLSSVCNLSCRREGKRRNKPSAHCDQVANTQS